MTEMTTFRKNKVELSEYDYTKDVKNRMLMAQFTPMDIEVLEEILYNSLRTPISVLAKNLDLSETELFPILKKLSETKLFALIADHVLLNKEMRKYYEFQVAKFQSDFKPGMEYLQGLLRKVPIHLLPNWYSIPRSSDNIFDSIVEKYLFTPQVFHRYLSDLTFSDPVQKEIMNDVYWSSNFEVEADTIMKKYGLSREDFEYHMLFLEFSFICCVTFRKEEDQFKEVVTPFYEWSEYLSHLQKFESKSVPDQETIVRKKKKDFAFLEEMTTLLELSCKSPLSIHKIHDEVWSLTDEAFAIAKKKTPELSKGDLHHLISKLCMFNFAEIKEKKLHSTEEGKEWLNLTLEEKALSIYRHSLNTFLREDFSETLRNDKALREAEKSILRALDAQWVFLDDFLKGIHIPLVENQTIKLIRNGRTWKYCFPEYSEEEVDFIKAVIKEWLFELGITALGMKDGRECFCVTPFGQGLFGSG